MKVKIDTKEKFHVITPDGPGFSANMTADLESLCLLILESDKKNVIVDLSNIIEISLPSAEILLALQAKFYDNSASFVICCMNKTIEKQLDEAEILEMMNVTKSQSEAWDIVQMEEIERELLDDENN